MSVNPTTLFDLVDANDMSPIWPLTHAYGRSLKPVFNGPGTFSFTLPLDAEEAYLVANRSTGVKITRNDQPIWSGGVTNVSKAAQANTMSVAATGWLEEFDHRYVRKSEESALTFANAYDGVIAEALVNACNAQTDSAGFVRPVRVIFGSRSSQSQRTRSYHVGDNYGASLRELTTIENGGDIKIDPVTRLMRFVANTEYTDRTEIHFGYGTDPNNLADANETSDGTNLFNRENAVTSGGIVASADDQDAIARAGGLMLEEWVSLSDVSDVNIAGAYANAELVVKSHGLTTYQLTPAPYGDLPRPYDDFDWGDQAYFSVDQGAMQIDNQAVRLFAGTINYTDEGDEVLAELEVAMSS